MSSPPVWSLEDTRESLGRAAPRQSGNSPEPRNRGTPKTLEFDPFDEWHGACYLDAVEEDGSWHW
jgi:hypothetical protein